MAVSYAAPKYEEFVVRSKMSEAFSLIGDTKTKLTEFYIMNSRFPRTSTEAESIQTDTFTPPEFVREIKLNLEHEEHQVAIEVYFKEGAIPGAVFDGHFVYVAGNPSSVAGSMVEWSCGAEGIEPQFLPSRCQ